MRKLFSKAAVISGLADLSINLASGWLGVLLVSPGFFSISTSKYIELLTLNLPAAIIALLTGIFLRDRSAKI